MVNTSFQSVELSLPELLLSRAPVRFTQPDKLNLLTDTVYFTLPGWRCYRAFAPTGHS